MHRYIFTLYLTVFIVSYGVSGQNENITDSKTEIPTSTFPTSTKPSENKSCEAHNNDCKACVDNSKCFYCETTDKCHPHIEKIVDGQCDMKHAYFLTCKTNFKVMLIIIGVLSAIPVLIIIILCCYCCCKKKGYKLSKDDIKWARQREERKQIAAERRKERAERTEEIRKKYGLVKDSNPYQRFDA